MVYKYIAIKFKIGYAKYVKQTFILVLSNIDRYKLYNACLHGQWTLFGIPTKLFIKRRSKPLKKAVEMKFKLYYEPLNSDKFFKKLIRQYKIT